ncbi:MAG: MFS transporter [Sulfobacillus acidophilus]|uniref:MFS transporter n=1 Tax=Sulfobacillus acidophilus TaxID=53633 RepID=A0A2T2WEX5_9FIRM|nr:MAG: MFS transporter [Sulfobacillus acidophilus]
MKSLWPTGTLAQSPFLWFYAGRTISLFGSGMTPVALAFAILSTRHGQALLGPIMAAEILPNIIMLLIGGSVADRYRRDRLMQAGSIGAGLTQAGIAAIVLTRANPYALFPLAILNGVLAAFTAPATRGILPQLIDPEDIAQANAYLNASRSAAKILGPAASGVLAATVGGGWAIALDALSFFLASACFCRISTPSHPTSPNSLLRQIQEGWTYFIRQPWIWPITAAFAVMNLVQMGAWRVLGPIIALRTFGAAGWGLVLSLQAVGLLLGSLGILRIHVTRPLMATMTAATLVGLPMLALGLKAGLLVLMLAAIASGIGSAISTVTWNSTLQQGVPPRKMSQVMAIDDLGSFAAIPIGLVLALPLAHRVGLTDVETIGGLIWITAAMLPLAQRHVREMTGPDIRACATEIADSKSS